MARPRIALLVAAAALILSSAPAAQTPPAQAGPAVTQGDFIIRNHTFRSGETLPEVKLHYRTLGTAQKDARGVVTNAVLVMHGPGGTGAQFCQMASATAVRASRATACARSFRTTAISTWWT